MDTTLSSRHGSETEVFTTTQGTSQSLVLNDAQQLALEWLMGGGTVGEASQYAGVCRQTVSEWLNHDPNFRGLFLQWREQVTSLGQARLIALSETAVDTVATAIREARNVKVALIVLKSLGMLGAGG